MHDEVFQEDISSATYNEHEFATKKLLKRLHNGDDAALDIIVENNLPLVHYVAKHFLNRGCEYEDLLQIGAIGLVKAARNYNFTFDVRFSTYAVPLISGEIKRFLRDDGIIKISRSIKENSLHVARARENFERHHGREPTISELGCECNMKNEDVIQAMESSRTVMSIYESNSDDNDTMIIDKIEDNDTFSKNELKLFITELLNYLDDTDRKIVIMRYFKEMTQAQIADLIGLTQVQVSRREKKILSVLREKVG